MSIHLFCLPREKSLNLQVEIILGIILIITPYSLINYWPHCSIFWIQHSSDFPALLSWLSFHIWFFSNIVWFVSILFRHQTLKNWFDIVWWLNCFVWGSLMRILFCVIRCTPEVYVYCNKLSVAHQGDRFTSCENIISCTQTLLLSPAFPGIDPVRVDDNVEPGGGCALEK